MISFRRESELLTPVCNYVRRHGYRWQKNEVAFFEYRIDLYGYSRVESASVAIELKLKNWRRALEQTIVYQLCADLVFAALPRTVVTKTIIDAFDEYGIGIIGVAASGRCTQLLRPRRSEEVRPWYRDHFITTVCGTKA